MSQSEDNKAVWGCVSAVLVAVIGGLVTLAVNDKLPFLAPPPTVTFTPTVPPPTPTPIPTPDSANTTILAPLPANYGCPADARAGWLPYRDTWYGIASWNGYQLSYDIYSFYVYDPFQWNTSTGSYGLTIPYSNQISRNVWQQLNGSPFWVCIDQSGNVYSVYVSGG